MAQRLFSLALPANLGASAQFRQVLQDLLHRLCLSSGLRDQMLIALSEAVVNIVEHAYPPANHIEMGLFQEDGYWLLDLADDGGPVADFDDLLGNSKSLPADHLSTSGLGMALIQQACDRVEYAAAGDRCDMNHLSLFFTKNEQRKKYIAVVDDDPVMHLFLQSCLEERYRVQCFSDVIEAFTAFSNHIPDIVISDIKMPGLSGFDLRKMMRGKPAMALIPFLYLTGSRSDRIQNQAGSLYIDGYLQKPVRKADLLSLIQQITLRRQDIASSIQNSLEQDITARLVPEMTEAVPGYDGCLVTRPAYPGGGDYFKTWRRSDSTICFLVDVMGHDQQAKYFSHVVAGYLEGFLYGQPQDQDIQALATNLSACARQGPLSDTFFTFVIARFFDNGKVQILSAGHPPPLLYSAEDGKSGVLPTGGPAPGILDEPGYEMVDLVLQPGDRICLYTDGVECLDIGIDPLSLFQDTQGLALEEISAALQTRLDPETAHFAMDDVTLVMFERQSES